MSVTTSMTMTKHIRTASSSHNRYSNPMPVPLASNYASPRITIQPLPPTYYAPVPPQSHLTAMQQAQHAYDPYSAVPMQQTVMSQSSSQHVPQRASSGAWTPQDDQGLLAARSQGLNWSQIQATYFPGKSPNACRKRHERLMERKGADDWDNRKTERMAKEYMAMRKEIWSGLAAKTGEKWSVVEQKCLQAGLKNLQMYARAYTRRERMAAGQPLSPYDENTLALMTPVDELDPSYSSPETTSSTTGSGSGAGGVGDGSSSRLPSISGPSGSAGYGAQATAATANAMQQQMAQMNAAAAVAAASGYYGGPSSQHAGHHQQHHQQSHHGYTSSVSSTGTTSASYGAPGTHSQDGSPYMGAHHPRGQRLPSADMGIDAIINRPNVGGGGGQPQV